MLLLRFSSRIFTGVQKKKKKHCTFSMPTSAYLQNFTCETQQLGDNLSLLYDCMSSVADAAPNNNNNKKKEQFFI